MCKPKQTHYTMSKKNKKDKAIELLLSGIKKKDLSIIQRAFKNGAKPNDGTIFLEDEGYFCSSFFYMLKIFPEAFQTFVDNGLNLERETFCAYPLMDAINLEKTEIIRKLFEIGVKDECFYNDDDLEGSSCSAVEYAVRVKKEKSLNFLLDNGYKHRENEKVLSLAISGGSKTIVEILLNHGYVLNSDNADLDFLTVFNENYTDKKREATVHDCFNLAKKTRTCSWCEMSIKQAHEELHRAVLDNMHITFLTLLDSGVPIKGWIKIPLIADAVRVDNVFAIKELIARGVDVNEKDFMGRTPIFYFEKCSLDTVKLLVQHGADVNVKDNSGVSPLTFLEMKIRLAKRYSEEDEIPRLKKIHKYLADNGAVSVNEYVDNLMKKWEKEKKE